MKKIRLSVLLISLILLTLPRSALGLEKTEYYKSVFDSWGVVTYTVKDLDVDNKTSIKYLTQLNHQIRVLLVASEVELSLDSLYEDIYLICDQEFNYLNVYCDSKKAEGKVTQEVIYKESKGLYEVSLYQHKLSNGKSLTLVPESQLYTPKFREKLKEYFISLQNIKTNNIQDDIVQNKTVYASINDFVTAYKIDYVFYVVLMAYAIIILQKFVRYLINFRNIGFLATINNVTNYLSNSRWVLFYFISLLFLGYIPILTIISLIDTKTIDLTYITKYLLTTISISKLSDYIQTQQVVRIMLLFYNSLLFVSIGLFLLPEVLTLSKQINLKVPDKENTQFLFKDKSKLLVILLTVLLVPAFIFGFSPIPFYFALCVIFYISYFDRKVYTVTLPNRVLLLIFSILVIFASALFLTRREKIIETNVFYGPTKIISLPYNVELRPFYKFLNDSISLDFSLFANGYLIYAPGYNEILNLPYSEFNESFNKESIAIISGYFSDISKFLIKNDSLRSYFYNNSTNPTVEISNFKYNELGKYLIDLTIDCSVPSVPTEISLEYTYLSIGQVGNSSLPILKFPGCGASTTPITYSLYLEPTYTDSNVLLLNIFSEKLIQPKFLSIDMKMDGKPFLRKYLNINNENVTFVEKANSKKLVVFTNIPKKYSITNIGNSLGIGNILNDIKSMNDKIKNIKLWSIEPGNPVIYNGYYNN